MKKIIVTTLATTAMALGAFAQGSLGQVQGMFSNDGITTQGANASNPNLATTWYTGNIALELFYASTATTAAQIATINALDGTPGGGLSAFMLLGSSGFSLVSSTTLLGSTAGSLAFPVSGGGFNAADPNTIGLLAPAPTAANGWMALYLVGSGGAFNDFSGVLAFAQNTGGSPVSAPPGTAAVMAKDPAGLNLVLTQVPEPTTMALAALGGASLLLFRRKK